MNPEEYYMDVWSAHNQGCIWQSEQENGLWLDIFDGGGISDIHSGLSMAFN